MTIQSLIREMARQRRQEVLAECDRVNSRSPIRYAPHQDSDHDKEVSLAVAQVNAAMGQPLFCCHGKLARIQCHKCG
jgi:hypothetical protein